MVAIGRVSEENTDLAVYLYDTKGTYDNFDDDTYITFGQTNGSGPNLWCTIIKGDYVTWLDATAYNACTTNGWILKGYKISTAELFVIDDRVGAGSDSYKRDGDLVVYDRIGEDGNGDRDIYLFNLSNRTKKDICTANGDQSIPHIKGSIVIWSDTRDADSTPRRDIYMYDLNTEQESIVAGGGLYSRLWSITNGEWIVYTSTTLDQTGNPYCELRKYHIPTNSDYLITSGENSILIGDINSSFVAWTEGEVKGEGVGLLKDSLYLHNLTTGENILIDEETNRKIIINVSLNESNQPQLVYSDDFVGDVFGFDLTSKTNYSIRTAGETWFEINLNETSNTVIMTSVGVNSLNPNEWDVSLAFIP